MSTEQATVVRDVERLAHGPLELATLPERLLEPLAEAVAFDAFCWGALDPATLLTTRATGTLIPFASPLLWEVQDLHARDAEAGDIRDLVRSGRPVGLLSENAGECEERSPMYQRILCPHGIEHQLRAVLRIDGMHWGQLRIARRAGQPDFSREEVGLVEALIPLFGHAFRRWLLANAGDTPEAGRPTIPGVIVLDEDNEIDSISPEAEHWLTEWGFADLSSPPAAIAAVVAVARARAAGHDTSVPSARLRLPTGAWLHVHATHLTRPDPRARTAVVLERASIDQVGPLIARANQLTSRETEIALLVLRGLSTNEIAAELFISSYTVQDHLKAIFEKVGVRSRRALVTEIFEPHYLTA